MNRPHRAAAVATALTAVEALVDAKGWDAYPTLLGMFDTTSHTGSGSLDIEELPIEAAVWQLHTVPGHRMTVPYWIGLNAITQTLTTVKAAQLRTWTHAQQGPLVAMAFLSEGLDTSDDGRQAAAAHGLPADPDGIPMRALTAYDIDGRFYQLVRLRGAASTRTVVTNAPTQMQDIIPECPRRLLTAARA